MSSPTTTRTEEDPFRLGWRYIREVGPDGEETTRTIPLTEQDLLFPQEGDHPMQRRPHTRDMQYLPEAFRSLLRARESLQIFSNHRIDFNLPGVEPLGPDVAIIEGVENFPDSQGTLYLAEEGQVLLVAEITSPDTRNNDLGIKRDFYERAGVPFYVIVDHTYPGGEHEVRLLVLRLTADGYRQLRPGVRGMIRLGQLGLSLALEGDKVWVYDQLGRRCEELPDLRRENLALHAEREASEMRNQEMETEFENEIDLRRAAERARVQAELTREQAVEARQVAEAQLARERTSLQAMVDRLRQLEEQLQQKPSE